MLGAAVWIAPAIFATVSNIAQRRLRGEPMPNVADLLFTGLDWLIYGILAPVIFAVCNRWPVVRPVVRQRVALHAGFAVLTAIAWAVGGKLLQFGLNFAFRREQLRQFLATLGDDVWRNAATDILGWIFVTLPFGAIVYTCVAVLAHALRYLSDARERELQLARVSEQLTGARFAALQAQINPHFLFNTLNTIASLIRQDPEAAEDVTTRLAELFRYALRGSRQGTAPLRDELEFLRHYLAIEHVRFGDRLRVEESVAPGLDRAIVPSLLLQPLVENAVRYAVAERLEGGRIQVSARAEGGVLVLEVVDDGPGLDPATPPSGNGFGLHSVRERLRAAGPPHALDIHSQPGQGTRVRITVPLVTAPSSPEVSS